MKIIENHLRAKSLKIYEQTLKIIEHQWKSMKINENRPLAGRRLRNLKGAEGNQKGGGRGAEGNQKGGGRQP